MIKQKIILGLIGEIGSGKGLVSQYLKDNYQASIYKFSDPLRDILKRLQLKNTRIRMQSLSTTLRAIFGQDLLSKIIAIEVKKDKNKIIVIDGIRRLDDLKYLKKLKNFKLIYITSDIKTRYNRIITRNENLDEEQKTFEQFLKDNQDESEKRIAEVAKISDIKIINNQSIKSLYKKINTLLKI